MNGGGQDSLIETRTERSNYENKSSCRACVQHSAVYVECRVCVASTIHLILTAAPTNGLDLFRTFFHSSIDQRKVPDIYYSTHIFSFYFWRKGQTCLKYPKPDDRKNKIRLARHLSGQGGYLLEITPSPCLFPSLLTMCVRSWYMPRIKGGGGSLPLLFCMGRE